MGSKKLVIIMIVIVLVLIIGLGTVIVLVAKKNKEEKNNRDAVLTRINSDSNEEVKISELDETSENETETEIEKETKNLEVATFNMQFESYANNDISAQDIKNLVQLIEKNNSTNEAHTVRVDTTVSSVTVSKKYNVETIKNEEGYIDTIKITESQSTEQQNTNESDIDKARFNSKYIAFDEGGEISGSKIRELINEVISNNSQNATHIIDVQTSTISEVNDEEKYSILLKYDENGWINQIFIEKKD